MKSTTESVASQAVARTEKDLGKLYQEIQDLQQDTQLTSDEGEFRISDPWKAVSQERKVEMAIAHMEEAKESLLKAANFIKKINA